MVVLDFGWELPRMSALKRCAYHAVRKELIRICGPWAMACMTFQPWFFWGAVKMNGRWREFGCTVQGAEAAGDFLLDLHHAGIAFGLIVGEGHQHKDNEGVVIPI